VIISSTTPSDPAIPTAEDTIDIDSRTADLEALNSLNPCAWRDPSEFVHQRLENRISSMVNRSEQLRFKRNHIHTSTNAFATHITSSSSTDASAWLNSQGTYGSHTLMTDTDFAGACRLLLRACPEPEGLCGFCTELYHRPVTHSTDHCFTCPITRPMLTSRHDHIRDEFVRTARMAINSGTSNILTVESEPTMTDLTDRAPNAPDPTTAHRADVLLVTAKNSDGDEPIIKTIVDVTGTHPVSGRVNGNGVVISSLPLTQAPAHPAGHQAEKRAAAKVSHYSSNYHVNNLEVVPFVFETSGRFNLDGRKLLSMLARIVSQSACRQRGLPVLFGTARMQLAQRISVIIQTHNARAYRKYVSGLLRSDARLPVRTG